MISEEGALGQIVLRLAEVVANLDTSVDIKAALTNAIEQMQEQIWGSEVANARQTHYVRDRLQTFQHKYLKEVTRSGTLEQQLTTFKGQIEALLHEQLKLADDNYALREELGVLQRASLMSTEQLTQVSEHQQEASKWKQVCNALSLQVRSLILKSAKPPLKASQVEELQSQNVELLAQVIEVRLKATKDEADLRQDYAIKLESAIARAQMLEAEREFAKAVLVQTYTGIPLSRVSVLETLLREKDNELNLAQKTNLQLEEELNWLQTKVQSIEAQVTSVQHERDNIQTMLKGSETYQDQLQKAVKDLEHQLIGVSRRRSLVEQIEEKKQLVCKLEETTRQLTTLHHEHQAALRRLEVSETSVTELSQALTEINQEQLKVAADDRLKYQGEIQSLAKELVKMRQEHKIALGSLSMQKTQLEEEAEKLKETAVAHEKCAELLETTKSKHIARVANMKLKHSKTMEEANLKIAKLINQEAADSAPKYEVEQFKQQIEELNEQIEEITEENLNLQKLIGSSGSANEVSKALVETQAELEVTRTQLIDSQIEAAKLTHELKCLHESVANQFPDAESNRAKSLVRPMQELSVAALQSEVDSLRETEAELADFKLKQQTLDTKYSDRIGKARDLIKKKHESIRILESENRKLSSQVIAPEQVGKLCFMMQKLLSVQKLK